MSVCVCVCAPAWSALASAGAGYSTASGELGKSPGIRRSPASAGSVSGLIEEGEGEKASVVLTLEKSCGQMSLKDKCREICAASLTMGFFLALSKNRVP